MGAQKTRAGRELPNDLVMSCALEKEMGLTSGGEVIIIMWLFEKTGF